MELFRAYQYWGHSTLVRWSKRQLRKSGRDLRLMHVFNDAIFDYQAGKGLKG